MMSMVLSLLNVNTVAEERYTKMATQGPFEIRLYPRMIIAKVKIEGQFQEAILEGVKHLKSYVEGNNFKVMRMSKYGPFFHVHRPGNWEIMLVLPPHLSALDAPKPINRLVQLEEIVPRRVGILRYNGPYTTEVVERRAEELKKWLNYRGLGHVGHYKVTHHDNVLPLPFLKDSEIHLDIM